MRTVRDGERFKVTSLPLASQQTRGIAGSFSADAPAGEAGANELKLTDDFSTGDDISLLSERSLSFSLSLSLSLSLLLFFREEDERPAFEWICSLSESGNVEMLIDTGRAFLSALGASPRPLVGLDALGGAIACYNERKKKSQLDRQDYLSSR